MLQTNDLHTYVDDPTGFDWRNHATQSGGDSTKPQSWYMDNAHLRMFVEALDPNQQPKLSPYADFKTFKKQSDGVADSLNQLLKDRPHFAITPRNIVSIANGRWPLVMPTAPVDRLLDELRYRYRGYFNYVAGTVQSSFQPWLVSNSPAAIQERQFVNCWELFLYPAIVEGVIAKTDILDAYTNLPVLPDGNRATVAHSVLRKLEDISIRQNLGGVVRVDRQTQTCNLQPGDLVIQPAQDDDRYVRDPPRLDDSLDNVMWHVMIVMEIPADRDFEEIKMMHIYHTGSGGLSDLALLGDVFTPQRRTYHAIRVTSGEPLVVH